MVHASLADITNRRRLDHVTDSEALDSLVLGDASRTVRAADEVDVAAAVLVAAVVSSLLGLQRNRSATESLACHPEFSLAIQHFPAQISLIPHNNHAKGAPKYHLHA